MLTTLAAVLLAAVAQAPPSSADVDAITRQFSDLETRLLGAIQAKNAQTLEEIVSPRFGFSLMIEGREPAVMNRSEWLKVTTTQSQLDGFELRSVAAGSVGDHAIVRAQAVRRGSVGSKDLTGEYVFVDLWDKEDGVWKIRYRVVARPVPPLNP